MEIKHLWKVMIDNMHGEETVITSHKDLKEVIAIIEKHDYKNATSIQYMGEALS